MTGTLCTSGKAILKKGEGRTIKAGGAWVFDNEIARTEGTFADGEIIAVEDFDGYFMGWGFYNSASKIRIRMLAFPLRMRYFMNNNETFQEEKHVRKVASQRSFL